MPKVIGTTGSGRTKWAILRFDWIQPGDADARVKAAIETFERSSFTRLSGQLAGLATSILDEADFPCNAPQQRGGWNV